MFSPKCNPEYDMKKVLLIVIAAITLFTNLDLQAQSFNDYIYNQCDANCPQDLYLKAFGGANFLQTDSRDDVKTTYDVGYIVSGGVGYCWNYGLRFEAEYAYRRNSLDRIKFFGRSFSIHGHFQSSSYMANLLWDIPLRDCGCNLWKFKPFIGAGIGYDFQQVHGKNSCMTYIVTKKGFAWQVIAGLAYPILRNADFSLEYKFHQGSLSSFYSHSLGVGLRYNFGMNL